MCGSKGKSSVKGGRWKSKRVRGAVPDNMRGSGNIWFMTPKLDVNEEGSAEVNVLVPLMLESMRHWVQDHGSSLLSFILLVG